MLIILRRVRIDRSVLYVCQHIHLNMHIRGKDISNLEKGDVSDVFCTCDVCVIIKIYSLVFFFTEQNIHESINVMISGKQGCAGLEFVDVCWGWVTGEGYFYTFLKNHGRWGCRNFPPPPLGPDQLGDRPHKSRDYIYTHSPQDLDQKNGSVNLVQSENDMMFRNIKKHIRERWKHTMSELPGKEKKVFISLICRLTGK